MRFKFLNLKFLAVLILVVALSADVAQAARIKDLVNIKGVRNNQLIGFGLVIGLQGTGDRATNVFFSIQAVVNMLRKLGVTVPEARIQQLQFKNVATVLVTADLQAFSKQGDHLDVLVSSLANATSLQGGTLLLCPLKGPDGEVYAVAQGALSIGGFSVQGAARGVQKNHLTVGRVANGGIVEKEIPTQFNSKKEIFLTMKQTDFTTGERIARKINDMVKDEVARPEDGRTIRVEVPLFYKDNTSAFVTQIETLTVEPDTRAKVVIDERTGTVVMGENVRISRVAVAHGNLFIQIREEPLVSQPAPLSGGETVGLPRTRITVEEGQDKLLILPKGVALGKVVNALNSIGVTPRDLIAILQAIKVAGALHAQLEII